MKNHYPILVAITLALTTGVHAEDPQELKNARNIYQQSVQRATDPLKARYVSDLTRLRESFTRAGKLAEAVAVDTEIKTITGQAPAVAAVAEIAPANGTGTSTISARSDTGAALGPAKKGQRIRVQYVEGAWSSAGGVPVSPDIAPHAFVKLAVVGVVNGQEEVITIVPNGTKTRPFSDGFKKDYEQVWLRINDHTKADNVGEVTYKASIR